MKSKAYRAVDVNRVELSAVLATRGAAAVQVGLDVGKSNLLVTLRWGGDDFDRPWKVRNPDEVVRLAELLAGVGVGRTMTVAMEPTGTYGDATRQALERANVVVHRVSPKAASDYAEVFDGVPSQHDGKDAGVVAELAAQGKSWPWPLAKPSELEQELAYHVDLMDGYRRQMMQWFGRVEALLSRHWPEATKVVALSSMTLLNCLAKYGGPSGLASASEGLKQVKNWGGHFLSAAKAGELVASAKATVGVSMGRWDEQRVRRFTEEILRCHREMTASKRRLVKLTKDHAAIVRMGAAVGVGTACVLWVELGDPAQYSCGAAYRKAMGLNLAERSSGRYQGKLKISKRGSSKVRRWLYLAALRSVRQEPVKGWYLRQKASRRGQGKAAVVGVMRKLALALYHVGGRGEPFDVRLLFRVDPA